MFLIFQNRDDKLKKISLSRVHIANMKFGNTFHKKNGEDDNKFFNLYDIVAFLFCHGLSLNFWIVLRKNCYTRQTEQERKKNKQKETNLSHKLIIRKRHDKYHSS